MNICIEQALVNVSNKLQAISATFSNIAWATQFECDVDQPVLSGYGLILQNITDDVGEILDAVQNSSNSG